LQKNDLERVFAAAPFLCYSTKMEEKTNGLLLHSLPYLGGQRIIKILTAEHGLITLIAYKKISAVLTSPFVWAEWIYKNSCRPMLRLEEGALLDDLRELKTDYSRLKAAGSMANDLLRTQLPGKMALEPLKLALTCFKKLPLFQKPELLAATFRLKLLLCEGLLHEEELISPSLRTLGLSRSFQELASLPLNTDDIHTANILFTERFHE
jgi:recombinational DNA repair protein (RecF pathway)